MIILFFTGTTIVSCVVFLFIMNYLRNKNFKKNGERIDNWRDLSDELQSAEIKYHNESVYKAFEFYIKIVLAIFGAIGIASVSKEYNEANIISIIEYLGYGTLIITLLFAFMYVSHQKAKIERWKKRFKWFEPLMWNECWLFSISIAIAIVVNCSLIPELIENLTC
ncbi:hypothetical protein [uncultured Kordia sp.]|uniref:hypothetical protein n=1 Tax=uncultured Kordia sp. TaxID=507699 RepID=UPI00261934F2|nr:hypothetical protein [uncultured Kordia sp.]